MISESRCIRILVCDDQPIARAGIGAIIAQQPDMEIVAEAEESATAVLEFHRYRPDVTLIDLATVCRDGGKMLTTLQKEFPGSHVLIITNHGGAEAIYRALQAGAKGFLLRTTPRHEMLEAIRAVADGQIYLPKKIAARLAEHVNRPALTPRENEVLMLMVGGHSNQEIGARLFISEGTVKAHINSMLAKMRARDRTQAVLYALRHGLARLDISEA